MLNTALPPGFVQKSTALVNTFTSHKSSNALVKRHLVANTRFMIGGVDVRDIDWAAGAKDSAGNTADDESNNSPSQTRDLPVDTNQVVSDAIWFVEPFAFNNGITIRITGERLAVGMDSDRLKRVLINLLSNAIQFSFDNGKIEVSVSYVQGFAKFSVQDQGCGIPADRLDSIFERRGNARNRTAGEVLGSGLGLPICKELVEAEGGSIGVGSSEAGSYFWFTVPLAQ